MDLQQRLDANRNVTVEGERTLNKNAIKSVIAHFTTNNDHAVADQNAESWFQNLFFLWSSEPDRPVQVFFATNVMFAQLRIALKQGLIEELKLSVDGEILDIILPNGKLIGSKLPKGLECYEECLYKLL